MVKFSFPAHPLVFQIFKAAAGILCPLPVRSVYSVCKLHNPQTSESKANQEEKRRLATHVPVAPADSHPVLVVPLAGLLPSHHL